MTLFLNEPARTETRSFSFLQLKNEIYPLFILKNQAFLKTSKRLK